MPEVEAELAARLARGEELVLATVIGLDGEPPSRPGAKTLMGRTSALAGTLGCSEFDAAALADAPGVLEGGAPALRTYSHDLGSIQVYLEPYPAAPTLVVLAATPVAAQLVRWAPDLGFRTVLVETRPERLGQGQWSPGVLVSSLAELPDALGEEVYAVHTDHDAPDLVEAVHLLLGRSPRFLGVMGSRRHTGHHLEALRARGLPEDAVAAIRSPVGVDLGARTPAEIALSILAGLVAVRRGGTAGWMGGS
jgi:xanthine dehydrogenase accessory factor